MPQVDDLGGFSLLSKPRGLAVVQDGGHFYLVINNTQSSNRVVVIDFGSDLSVSTSLIQAYGFSFTEILENPFELDLVQEDGVWYAISAIHSSNKVYRYSFTNGLNSKPILTDLADVARPIAIEILEDKAAGSKVAYVSTESGDLHRLSFASGIAGTVAKVNLGKYGVLNNNYGMSFIDSDGVVSGFTINLDGALYKINIPNNCQGASQVSSAEFEPANIFYSMAGTYDITLVGTDTEGNSQRLVRSITVSDQQAPQLQIYQGENQCLSNPVVLTAENLTPTQTIA